MQCSVFGTCSSSLIIIGADQGLQTVHGEDSSDNNQACILVQDPKSECVAEPIDRGGSS